MAPEVAIGWGSPLLFATMDGSIRCGATYIWDTPWGTCFLITAWINHFSPFQWTKDECKRSPVGISPFVDWVRASNGRKFRVSNICIILWKSVCCGYVQGGQLLAAEQLFPGITLAEFADRRKALRSYLPTESLVILAAAPVKQMTDVVPYPFRQDADYLYYTGCQQPEGIAVLDDHTDLCMFMPDRDPEVWRSVLTAGC